MHVAQSENVSETKMRRKSTNTHNICTQVQTHSGSPTAESVAADEVVVMVGVGEVEATPGEFV